MGDRSNVIIIHDAAKTKRTYLYCHWEGTDAFIKVRNALARRARWTDSAYLARIVFCALVKGREHEETGFGISPSPTNSDHELCVIDVPNQRVSFHDYGDNNGLNRPNRSYSFEQFVKLSDQSVTEGD